MDFSQLVTGTDSKKKRAWEVCEVFIVCGYKGQSILSDRADTECVGLEQVLLPSRIMGNVVSRSVKGALSFLEVVHLCMWKRQDILLLLLWTDKHIYWNK